MNTKPLTLGLCVALAAGAARAEMAMLAWTAKYDGPGKGRDNAQALAVDASGSAYVTGFSDGGDGNYDFATLKYAPEGTEDGLGKLLWAARYDGEAKGADWARDVAVDGEGGVVVTGSSAGESTGFDFATVKYDADGNQLWVSRYDGPGHGDDRVKALAVDAGGNVYVTGDSPGEGGKAESVTLKYGPEGKLLWAARSGDPGGNQSLADIAVDVNGNVYVTGGEVRKPGNSDYVTIKYDPAGNTLWTVYRDWGANDDARFLALDAEGNAHVTGASLRRNEGPEVIGHEDIATVKYGGGGNELWDASFNVGEATNEMASALRLDGHGHVYVAGTVYGALGGDSMGSGAEYLAVKYGADGDQQWSALYRGQGGTEAVAWDGAVDTSGGVYLLGTERGAKPRLVTVKLGPDGRERWVVGHAGTGSGAARALAVGGAGAVWAAGSDDAGEDYLTVKYGQRATEREAPADGGG
jgi:hypothetical protein